MGYNSFEVKVNPQPSDSSENLWNAFRQGNERAFQQLYRLYARKLLQYGYKATNDRLLIEDSIHDLFIERWNSRANLSDTDSIKFYLVRSLKNKINRARSRDIFYLASEMEATPGPIDDFVIENNLIEQEGKEQVYAQLRKSYELLTPRQQEALNLRFYQHFSNEEIAQIMGVNYQSACKFIYTGLKALRQAVRLFAVFLICPAIEQVIMITPRRNPVRSRRDGPPMRRNCGRRVAKASARVSSIPVSNLSFV